MASKPVDPSEHPLQPAPPRFPVTLTAADLLAACGATDDDPPEPIDFPRPAPAQSARRVVGAGPARLHRLLAAHRLGRGVGARGRQDRQHRLSPARREGADSFAIAWDKAFEEGLGRLREDSLDRALNGALVPVYRGGRMVRVEHRRNDRLAIALLGGRNRNIDWYRQGALRRHVYKMEQQARDAERAENKRREAEAQASTRGIAAHDRQGRSHARAARPKALKSLQKRRSP